MTDVDGTKRVGFGTLIEAGRLRRIFAQAALVLVLGVAYTQSLLPGAGHSHDTAEAQFSVPLLCVTHPTGYPTYLLLGHAFTRLVPFGTPAYRTNLLSALFGVLACLVVRRLLRRLGARELVAWSVAVAFGLTPTFWKFSVVAEMYSLNLLFVALVSDSLLKWRQTLRDRDFIVACAWYVVSFGNHLTMVTLLPAFIAFVIATRWRVVVEWKLVCAVSGMILLGLAPYAYPLVRSLDPHTPYLSYSVTNLGELWGYATGSVYKEAMFAFATPRQILERVPLFAPYFWNDCGPLIPLAVVGLAALADRVTVAYLGLVALGHLVFAQGFDGGDVDNYYLPIYFATAVLAGVGLEWLLSSREGRRMPASLCLCLPLALGAYNWSQVERMKAPERAEPMRQLLDEVESDGALVVARYNDYCYLLYFILAEGRGRSSVFTGDEVTADQIKAYLERNEPVYLPRTRQTVPPGLRVYSTRLGMRPQLRAAGLVVRALRGEAFEITRSGTQ